jgi:hypothetical protein
MLRTRPIGEVMRMHQQAVRIGKIMAKNKG